MALCITHAEPELTARPWFRVLNSHQGQSAYSGLVAELVIINILCKINFYVADRAITCTY